MEVERYNDRVMRVNIVIGNVVWEEVSCYFPQAKLANEKEVFYELIDILVNSMCRSSVKNVKVIPGEEIVSQHCLLSIDMVFKKKVSRKVKFRKKLKLWRLGETEVK